MRSINFTNAIVKNLSSLERLLGSLTVRPNGITDTNIFELIMIS